MNKFFIVIFAIFFIFIIQYLPTLAATSVGAKDAMDGFNDTAVEGYGGGGWFEGSLQIGLPAMIGKIIGTLLSFLGVVFFGIILYAGVSWILSLGNEEKITAAKNMIIAAVLGLVVVLGAYAITNIVARIFIE